MSCNSAKLRYFKSYGILKTIGYNIMFINADSALKISYSKLKNLNGNLSQRGSCKEQNVYSYKGIH